MPPQASVGVASVTPAPTMPPSGPGAVERRQDRPAVAVLERDRLHVGAGVDDAQPHAVHRHPGHDEHGHDGASVATGTATAIAIRPSPQRSRAALSLRSASRSASTEPTPASSTIISSSADSSSSERSQRSREVRQPGGQADEHEALGQRSAAATASRARDDAMGRIVARRRRAGSWSGGQTRGVSTPARCGWSGTARPSGAATGRHTSVTDLPLTRVGVEVAAGWRIGWPARTSTWCSPAPGSAPGVPPSWSGSPSAEVDATSSSGGTATTRASPTRRSARPCPAGRLDPPGARRRDRRRRWPSGWTGWSRGSRDRRRPDPGVRPRPRAAGPHRPLARPAGDRGPAVPAGHRDRVGARLRARDAGRSCAGTLDATLP